MMEQSQTDLLEELAHQRAMILALRKRLRVLELQMAQQGSMTPPVILTEIAALSEQVRHHEAAYAKLEIRAAEGTLSFAEAEYRLLLAKSWSAAQGWPTVIDMAQLELSRLQLGILPERAAELERDMRAALAREVVSTIKDGFFTDYLQGFKHQMTDEFWSLGRAIRLDVAAAIDQFRALLPPKVSTPTPPFEPTLRAVNQFWLYQAVYMPDFETFIAALPEPLRATAA